MNMGDNEDFFRLILLCFGVLVVFALISQLTSFGLSGPWAGVNTLIAPLALVICFVGIAVFLVVNR